MKTMIKLNDLIPTNLAEEKEKFFAQNCDYNPQFTYQKRIRRHELLVHGKPKWRYLRLAKKILKQAKKKQVFLKENNQIVASKEQLKDAIKTYLSDYKLEDKYQIKFSQDFIPRFAVNFTNNEIKVRLPISLPSNEIVSVLDHEIGTHVLRQENYLKQSWYRKKKRYGFAPHLKTEEGLAVIHTLLRKDNKLAYVPAMTYLAVKLGLKKDFKTVYAFFFDLLQDSEKAWSYAFKNKRGLRDTGYPASFTKSVNYFEGLVDVLKYLRRHQFDPSNLYYGKIAIKDIDHAKAINPDYKLILPKFYTDNPGEYKRQIKEIAQQNFIY